MKFMKIAILAFLVFCSFNPKAFAYLDPGSGSYFYQILLSFLLAVPFFIKSVWTQAALLIKKIFSRKKDADKK